MRLFAGLTAVVVSIAATAIPDTANAGIYTDDLSRCLVAQTSDEDKLLLAQWIFTVMSVHPSAASLAAVSDSDRIQVTTSAAKLFERLLTQACKGAVAEAVKYEGEEALGAGFEVLGEIAMNAILADPKVAAETQEFVKYVDMEKLEAAYAKPQKGG